MMRFRQIVVAAGIALVSCAGGAALAQPSLLDQQKSALEIDKLRLEVKRLQEEGAKTPLPEWVAPGGAFAGAVLSGLAAWLGARRARLSSYDLALLNARLASYRAVEEATMLFALYFPAREIRPADCGAAGSKLRKAYFAGTGIILSKETRDCYFRFQHALARASRADCLDVPPADAYATWVNGNLMDRYREVLDLDPAKRIKYRRVRDWKFGVARTADATANERMLHDGAQPEDVAGLFRDFVFLQTLSSALRTSMSRDIHGRSGPPG